jgi:Arc/MetJ-type ribon-helix-helix transcriptional regulator
MRTIQIRVSPDQLKGIDRKVKQGKYQSRSEAIRDYIRKAEFYEALAQFRSLVEETGLTEEEFLRDDRKVRKAVAEKLLAKTA